VALVVGEHEDTLELGKRAHPGARLPTPVVPLGKLDLGEVALAERTRHRACGKPLGSGRERHKLRALHGRARGRESFDLTMWFGEKWSCRLGAMGWFSSLDCKKSQGKAAPSVSFPGPAGPNPPILLPPKARVISATCLLISSANAVAAKLFSRVRCPSHARVIVRPLRGK